MHRSLSMETTYLLLQPILMILGGLFLGWLAHKIDEGEANAN